MVENEEVLQTVSQESPQEQPTVSDAPTEAIAQSSSKSDKENWRLMREREKKLERDLEESHRRLREYEAAKNKQSEEDDEVHLNPDDIPEWKHVDKKIKKLEAQIKGYQQQSAEVAIEARLKAQYPDFDSVVNQETIDMLRSAYPEVAATLNSSSDLYNKAASAYTIIKKMGIVSDTSYDKDKEIALRNASKPRPLTSVSPQEGSGGPLSMANAFSNGLTEDLKKQLYKEMIDARKKH